MKVGIIGGTGKMGRLFSGIFERAGHDVACSGRKTRITPMDIAVMSDLIIISVPINLTADVIRHIAPHLTAQQVICDLTSLKVFPVREMLCSKAEVIGLHPMFGPSVRTLAKQTIIVTPARCSHESLAMLTGIFEHEGARITITTPEAHDRMMAVVQGLTHFVTLSMAETMRRVGITPAETEPFMSPVYQIETGLVGRLLSQDPGLYADMLRMNPFVPAVLEACEHAVSDVKGTVLSGDRRLFEELFTRNSEHFGNYCYDASSLTDSLIEAMVKR
ncbi:MAG: prephenate dehydrogenase/arogenate dehydrogenase family protein [Bacteroidales bacterium]|jgi:prephenate dehydrogenase|nr:prephenate dehydrogenase/arogenate dehydrogenase family protein [Bacteroidales bacterium]